MENTGMDITIHQNGQIIHIRNSQISYVMEVVDGRYLVHRYFGKSIISPSRARRFPHTGICRDAGKRSDVF